MVEQYQEQTRSRPAHQQGLNVNANADHFGAALGRGARAMASGGVDFSDALAARDAVMQDHDVREGVQRYLADLRRLNYAPGTGFLTLQGENAVAASASHEEALAAIRDTHAANYTGAALTAFMRATDGAANAASDRAIIHTAGEQQSTVLAGLRDATAGFMDHAMLAAGTGDMEGFATHMASALAEHEQFAALQGWSADTYDRSRADVVSAMHMGALLRLADGRSAREAQAFFEANRDAFNADERLKAERLLAPLVRRETAAAALHSAGQSPSATGAASSSANRSVAAAVNRVGASVATGAALPSNLSYANDVAIRSEPITTTLANNISTAVEAIYGPGARVVVYSGGQPDAASAAAEGAARTGRTRHDHGSAADVRIYAADGRQITGDALAPLIQFWLASGAGSVGVEMSGGGIHLDEHTDGARAWDYADRGGSITEAQRAAIAAGLAGQHPDGWSPDWAALSLALRPEGATPGLPWADAGRGRMQVLDFRSNLAAVQELAATSHPDGPIAFDAHRKPPDQPSTGVGQTVMDILSGLHGPPPPPVTHQDAHPDGFTPFHVESGVPERHPTPENVRVRALADDDDDGGGSSDSVRADAPGEAAEEQRGQENPAQAWAAEALRRSYDYFARMWGSAAAVGALVAPDGAFMADVLGPDAARDGGFTGVTLGTVRRALSGAAMDPAAPQPSGGTPNWAAMEQLVLDELAKANPDFEYVEELERQIATHRRAHDRATARERTERWDELYERGVTTGDWSLSAADMLLFGAEMSQAFRATAMQTMNGVQYTDPVTYNELIDLMHNDPEAFSNVDLHDLMSSNLLDGSDYSKLRGFQRAIAFERTPEAKQAAATEAMGNVNPDTLARDARSTFENTMNFSTSNVNNMTEVQRKQWAAFQRALNDGVVAHIEDTGAHPTALEVHQMVHRLLAPVEVEQRGLLGSSMETVPLFWAEYAVMPGGDMRGRRVTMDELPESIRLAIFEAAQNLAGPGAPTVTEEAAMRLYNNLAAVASGLPPTVTIDDAPSELTIVKLPTTRASMVTGARYRVTTREGDEYTLSENDLLDVITNAATRHYRSLIVTLELTPEHFWTNHVF